MTDRYGDKLADQTIHGNDGQTEFFTLNDEYKVMSRVGQYIEVNIRRRTSLVESSIRRIM